MASFSANAVRTAIEQRATGQITSSLGNNISVTALATDAHGALEDDDRAERALVKPTIEVDIVSIQDRPRVAGGASGSTRFLTIGVRVRMTWAIEGVHLDHRVDRNTLATDAATLVHGVVKALETVGSLTTDSGGTLQTGLLSGMLEATGQRRTRFDRELLEWQLDFTGVVQET